jgi:hypothetical protein
MKSFYNVSLDLTGGAYRDDDFTYGNLTELQQALEFEFWNDTRAGWPDVLQYEDIPLKTYIRGQMKQEVNLANYITIRLASGTEYTLNKRIDWISIIKQRAGLAKEDRVTREMSCAFFASAVPYIDWGAIPLLPLEEPILKEGAEAEYEETYEGATYQEVYSYGLSGEREDADFRGEMDKALAIDPVWLQFNAGTVRALAESMHSTGDYSAMPVLADALQEAGCDNELFLWHCRSPACAHARGSWLVERLRRARVQPK